MTLAFSRLLRSAYRKEPISAFIFLFGTVDALLGGFGERWTLLSFGIVVVVFSLSARWLQRQQTEKRLNSSVPKGYLNPSKSTMQPLPELTRKQNYR